MHIIRAHVPSHTNHTYHTHTSHSHTQKLHTPTEAHSPTHPTMLTHTLSRARAHPHFLHLTSTLTCTPHHTHAFTTQTTSHLLTYSHTLLYFAVGTDRVEVALCLHVPSLHQAGHSAQKWSIYSSALAGWLRQEHVPVRTVSDDHLSFRPALDS